MPPLPAPPTPLAPPTAPVPFDGQSAHAPPPPPGPAVPTLPEGASIGGTQATSRASPNASADTNARALRGTPLRVGRKVDWSICLSSREQDLIGPIVCLRRALPCAFLAQKLLFRRLPRPPVAHNSNRSVHRADFTIISVCVSAEAAGGARREARTAALRPELAQARENR